MTDRVRAVLLTPTNEILTIRREREGTPPYWVLPGGGVEPTDTSLEATLHRELHEELAGTADIHSLIHIVEEPNDRQFIYLATITTWSTHDRSGPEFNDPTRGTYHLQPVPFTTSALTAIDLKPTPVAELLQHCLRAGRSLYDLPDQRLSPGQSTILP